jgi:enamine deaminase RidA (YjgF/YER057c/UK114 family)
MPAPTLGRPVLAAAAILVASSVDAGDGPAWRAIERAAGQAAGAAAVVVDDVPLVHTAQFAAASGPLDRQVADAVAQLRTALDSLASGLDRIVRLHVCAATDEAAAAALPLLEAALPAGHRPAITCVVGSLPNPGCLVALDAVATSTQPAREVTGTAAGRILPPGTRIFVSGQAKEADSVAEATRRTLEGLGATLDFLGRPRADVVQYKAFIAPAAEADAVRREIAAFHGAGPVPPVVIVEWKSAARLPVEIELVAWGGPAAAPAGPEFLTPPGMTASPIYCRVVRVAAPRMIYVGGLAAARAGDPADRETAEREVRTVLDRLGEVLQAGGSDLRHLVKATYYVSTEATSAALNAVRPSVYDPARPPAASKAMVPGIGRPDSGLVLDMIAVPAGDGPR